MSSANSHETLAADLAALRTSSALADGDHLACVRVTGTGARALVDRASPRPLFVRTGQTLHTLLLDDDARPIADVYICHDEDGYDVIAEGLPGPALHGYLADHAGGLAVDLVDQSASHAFLLLDGPYCWELLAEVTAPDVIGLPYLGFFHAPQFTCFRGGKSGEYGYELRIARGELDRVRARLLEVGERFALRAISRAAYELAMLESGFFNVARVGRAGLSPVELQLQWRVTADRAFPGSAALASHRAAPRGRAVMVAADRPLARDAAIELDGAAVGRVLDAGRSYTRGDELAIALLDLPVAHAGLTGFRCGTANVRTISSPTINNRSLYVDPQRHSWARRDTDTFPLLLRPRWS